MNPFPQNQWTMNHVAMMQQTKNISQIQNYLSVAFMSLEVVYTTDSSPTMNHVAIIQHARK